MRVCPLLCTVVPTGLVLNVSPDVAAHAQKPGVTAVVAATARIASPAATSVTSVTSVTSDAEKPLRSFYARFNLLALNHDFKALEDLLLSTWTLDWTSTDNEGQSQSRTEMKQIMRDALDPKLEYMGTVLACVVKKISRQGDTAYADWVTRMTHMEVDSEGKYGTRGKRHRHMRREPVRDTWVKRAGVWKIRHTRVYDAVLEVDSKPVKD
jgi:hypothetical protein